MGLDSKAVETSADVDLVGSVLKRQVRLAADLGFSATPSFALNGVGILGYPGPQAMARFVSAVRRCDRPACG
jgi:protein-disulfide isomerase